LLRVIRSHTSLIALEQVAASGNMHLQSFVYPTFARSQEMAVKPKALKELYARAAGRCALCPGFDSVCKEQVCDIDIDNKNI